MSMDPSSILSAMEQDLDRFSVPAPGELGTLSASLDIVSRHLRDLHDWALSTEFDDPAAEVAFFKLQLPAIEGRLFYFSQVLEVEQLMPIRSAQEKIAYYQGAFSRIESGYRAMGEFHRYHLLGANHLDDYFFRRQEGSVPAHSDFIFSHPRLRSPRSHDQARIVGLKLLEQHLEGRIWLLQQPFGSKASTAPLTWHSSRSALVELIYALLEIKAFGSEAQDVKRISEYFQQVFRVQIANIYATYEDNRLRKKDRTPFINALKSALERRMDHDDLHAL